MDHDVWQQGPQRHAGVAGPRERWTSWELSLESWPMVESLKVHVKNSEFSKKGKILHESTYKRDLEQSNL